MAEGLFARYEQDPKLAVFYGSLLARHMKKETIGSEHLLLGATWRQHAANCQFRDLKAQSETIWSVVGVPHLPITKEPYQAGRMPLNDSAKRVIAYTRMEAEEGGQFWIDIDHMLLGIIREGGVAADALLQAGWTAERIKAAAERGRKLYPPKRPPYLWKYRPYVRWIAWGVAGLLFVAAILYMRSQG